MVTFNVVFEQRTSSENDMVLGVVAMDMKMDFMDIQLSTLFGTCSTGSFV